MLKSQAKVIKSSAFFDLSREQKNMCQFGIADGFEFLLTPKVRGVFYDQIDQTTDLMVLHNNDWVGALSATWNFQRAVAP